MAIVSEIDHLLNLVVHYVVHGHNTLKHPTQGWRLCGLAQLIGKGLIDLLQCLAQLTFNTREMGRSILGADFSGVLVSDCLSIYDDLNPHQQKCYAHHLKAISNALKTLKGKGSAYLLELRALLHSAQVLKRLMETLPQDQIQQALQFLETRFEHLLRHP